MHYNDERVTIVVKNMIGGDTVEKTTSLNLRVDSAIKKRAESILSKTPERVNADAMTAEKLRSKLQKGLDDAEQGNVKLASRAFDEFRENH